MKQTCKSRPETSDNAPKRAGADLNRATTHPKRAGPGLKRATTHPKRAGSRSLKRIHFTFSVASFAPCPLFMSYV
ncbi:hypothetical protein WMZ97_08485 [Lentibacillus sp. N15]|uniref:hypothetical protein n=1 Tax=Lentibacillus songyuanensis TaxID=3136161 RepID=UPI0031BAECCF